MNEKNVFEEAEREPSFIQENYKSISKLFINHIGMMVFGLIVLIATKMMNNVIFHIMGVFSILMYMTLLYTAMWEAGAADKIKIDGGRKKRNLLSGFMFWAAANIASILFAVFIIAFYYIPALGEICGTLQLINNFYNGMYLSILNVVPAPFSYALILVPGLLVSGISYILGVKGYKCIFPEPKRDRNERLR